MKHKVLLAGKNDTIINDFFSHMDMEFECMTTSCRYEDMYAHLKYFKPEVFVYCPNGMTNDELDAIKFLMGHNESTRVPVVLIGADEDIKYFTSYAVNVADLTIHKPVTTGQIKTKLLNFIDDLEHKKNLEESMAQEDDAAGEQAGGHPFASPEMAKLDAALEEAIGGALAKKHILVVDDDALMLKMIKEHLRNDYEVATAPSGKIALKFLEKHKTDLILLDYEMPQESGPEVLEKIHNNYALRNIPVVFLTGITQREKIQQALAQKPQGYLLKPISRDKLIETIEQIIGGGGDE